MKQNEQPGNEPALEKTLKEWVVESPLPPGFQDRVWQRIARAETRPEQAPSFWALLVRTLEANLPRPKFAWSYVAILLLLGVVSGAWAAQRETTKMNAAMGSRYVQSIDPYHRVAGDQ